ncbi:MAG: glycosyltransferase family 4 protein [Candidatus Zixiibacteriota bacterium]
MSSSSLKVIYINADSGIPVWGGVGGSIHIREFVCALKEAGHSPTVVTARFDPSCGPEVDIPILQIPTSAAESFFASVSQKSENARALREAQSFHANNGLFDLLQDLRREARCDLVYERYSLFSFAGMAFAAEAGVPYVLEVNSPLIDETLKHRSLAHLQLAREIERYLFNHADHLIVVSEELRNYVRSVAPDADVSVVPNAVNPGRFARPPQNGSAPGSTDRARREFLVGYMGTLKPWHGLEVLLDAFAEFSAGSRGRRLVIIGDGRRMRSQLEKRCDELGIGECVSFTGISAYEDTPSRLQACDVLVAPYPELENFYFSPLKLFEYMASGRAIVASRVGQVAEILDDQRSGLLALPGDKRALARALERLEDDVELRVRLGAEARRVALAEHTWANRITQVSGVFEQLLANEFCGENEKVKA